MLLRSIPTALLSLFALALCLFPADAGAQKLTSEDSALQKGLPAFEYYRATRPDLRRCPSPQCGGVFVALVNRRATVCADESKARDCHAALIDWSALHLDDASEQRVDAAFAAGRVLARGDLVLRDLGFARAVPTLVVSDAWRGVTGNKPVGYYWGVTHSGIVCVTHPCPSFFEQLLNRRRSGLVEGVDLSYSEGSDEQIAEGHAALARHGLLIAGGHRMIFGPAGKGLSLIAAEFYVPVRGDAPRRCGGFTFPPLPACERGEFCEAPPDTCHIADLPGVCTQRPEVCPRVLDPVCGCDGVTYSNDCTRRAAAAALAHEGACDVDAEKCGAVLCEPGTTCCNPLRGICTPPGFACIQ